MGAAEHLFLFEHFKGKARGETGIVTLTPLHSGWVKGKGMTATDSHRTEVHGHFCCSNAAIVTCWASTPCETLREGLTCAPSFPSSLPSFCPPSLPLSSLPCPSPWRGSISHFFASLWTRTTQLEIEFINVSSVSTQTGTNMGEDDTKSTLETLPRQSW